MPFYSVKTPGLIPCRIYDANGKELADVYACNTDTGWAKHLTRDSSGEVRTDDNGDVEYAETNHPAPLRIVKEE